MPFCSGCSSALRRTFAYHLGNRSALAWVIDEYQVKQGKRSGIRSDPSRAVRVSLETVRIAKRLRAQYAERSAPLPPNSVSWRIDLRLIRDKMEFCHPLTIANHLDRRKLYVSICLRKIAKMAVPRKWPQT